VTNAISGTDAYPGTLNTTDPCKRVCCIGGARAETVGLAENAGRVRRPRAARPSVQRSAFAGFRFAPEIITVAVG
jgi:hypothetical protein